MNNSAPVIPISVVVPVYNAEARLVSTLDALSAQSFADFELILVNDGSKDRSLEICREYRTQHPDRKITVLDGPNQGVSRARNRGLDAAQGEWIAFCDSDDQPEPCWLEHLYANAVRDRADLSCCAFRDISPREEHVRMNFVFSESDHILENVEEVRSRFLLPLFSGNRSVHGYLFASLFRRDIIRHHEVRFPGGVSMKEDELFYMDYLGGTERITATAEPLYRYIRGGEDSATALHRKASDHRREENWLNYADARLRIFRKYELEKAYPLMEQELLLRLYAHEVQKICCDPEAGFFRKNKALRDVAALALKEKEKLRAHSASERIFLLALRRFPFLLPPLCAVKRRKENNARNSAS